MYRKVGKDFPVIAWWSGGASSAVVCWICIRWFGIENVRIVFIDTKNEHPDTYRFKKDCELWYDQQIETISSKEYDSIEEVWERYLSLNNATGAICSTELKRKVRQDFQNKNFFSYQAFGFDIDEIDRAIGMKKNYPDSFPIFPLIAEVMKKDEPMKILKRAMIEPPVPYRLGYRNNNCFERGCVQGGIGYWQKYKIDRPENFLVMAAKEHYLTKLKGEPVTILKDQSIGGGLVFLMPNPDYPEMKDLSMMKGRPVEPLIECNGFCNTTK